MSNRFGGIVLCGGESRRMGRPKAWLPFGNELMLPRVVRILREVVEQVVVVAAPGQELPELPQGVEIVRDERQSRGPLQGIAGGLRRMKELEIDAAFASSTDVPFLQPAFVIRLFLLLGDSMIAVPFLQDRHHPLAAVYRAACLPYIEELLAADRLRPVFLFDLVPTRFVVAEELAESDPTFQSLRNLNSPDEYEQACRELEAG